MQFHPFPKEEAANIPVPTALRAMWALRLWDILAALGHPNMDQLAGDSSYPGQGPETLPEENLPKGPWAGPQWLSTFLTWQFHEAVGTQGATL